MKVSQKTPPSEPKEIKVSAEEKRIDLGLNTEMLLKSRYSLEFLFFHIIQEIFDEKVIN